jgi:chitinase
MLAILVIAGIAYFAYLKVQTWQDNKVSAYSLPWFAPYVDVTAEPQYKFTKIGDNPNTNFVLAFIVAANKNPCQPTWGGAYDLQQAGTELDLDRRIARLRQLGGDIAISFGGAKNNELAETCTSESDLKTAYQAVITKYNVETLDFDLEGKALSNTEALKRRAATLAGLQKDLRAQQKNLAIWLTLPVTPNGLSDEGTTAVSIMLENGVDLAGVNIMTMDYGQALAPGQSLADASERALIETHRQLGILYDQAGIHLNSGSLWKKIGATPMLGQNDFTNEIYTVADAAKLNNYAQENGMLRLSMWSANRDIPCGDNYVNVSLVSDSCSGIKQNPTDFYNTLGKNFNGRLQESVSLVTTSDVKSNAEIEDNTDNSPYPIWNVANTYLGETKVVWHRNVYLAKWWTQGDLPDNPTLQNWQTPWELIGPVLPGEKAITQLTLPKGTYPEWSGTTQYDAGKIVLFNGLPYKAKWWTQGDSPGAASVNPNSSPWIALTQAQIKELLDKITAKL